MLVSVPVGGKGEEIGIRWQRLTMYVKVDLVKLSCCILAMKEIDIGLNFFNARELITHDTLDHIRLHHPE